MDKSSENKLARLDLLKRYYLDGSISDVLILLLIHSVHNPEYLEVAKYIYECFRDERGAEESMKVIFKVVLINICHMVNYCSDEGVPNRVTPDAFRAIFEFICDKYDLEATIFLQLIKPSKIEFRSICLEKAKKSQKYLGEAAEIVFISSSHLIDLDHVANIMYKFLVCQGLSIDEINTLFTKRIELVGFKFPTKEEKQSVKRNSMVMTVDFLAQLADQKTFEWFADSIKTRPMYLDCTLRIKTRIAKDLLNKGHLDDCLKIVIEINDLLDDFDFEGIDDLRGKLAIFNALNFKSLYHFACKNIFEGIQTLLEGYKVTPDNAFSNTHAWVLNLRFLESSKRKEIFDQFKSQWPIQSELKTKLLKWFKRSYELFEDPNDKSFREYEKSKDRLGEFTEPRLNEAIDRIFLVHSLYFYASCNKMGEVYRVFQTLQSKSYMVDYEYSLIILDILYSIPANPRLVDMLEKSDFVSPEVIPNILAWDVYLRLAQETFNIQDWNRAMYHLDIANTIFYANPKALKNLSNILLVSNKIAVIEAKKFGIKCGKFLGLIFDIDSPKDLQKFDEYLSGEREESPNLEDNSEQNDIVIRREKRDAYYEELIRQKAALTQNLRVVKNISYWKVEDRIVSSENLDSLNIGGNKVFVLVD